MAILVFGEGSTEKGVCNVLKKKNIIQFDDYTSAGGNTREINRTVSNIIRPRLEGGEFLNCVILYDLDRHKNKTEGSILQSIFADTGFLKKIDSFEGFDVGSMREQSSRHSNVHTLSVPEINFKIAIHIANKRYKESFEKSAIDDYVLELGLLPKTVINLLNSINPPSPQPKKVNISSDKIFDKVTQEIPDLLKSNANDIEDLTSAKDYVRFYAAVLKLDTSPPIFAEKVMNNADENDIREVFAALIAAFELVSSPQ
ncbi:hypothetical protein [Spirulina subsalsa]|uniref:hypothetical protein n=1 Tax=Spirulina subsalsa TaxID=54311 RepID=UPI0002D755F6|nr:hypothetical protein [Spirulina subsalsa]